MSDFSRAVGGNSRSRSKSPKLRSGAGSSAPPPPPPPPPPPSPPSSPPPQQQPAPVLLRRAKSDNPQKSSSSSASSTTGFPKNQSRSRSRSPSPATRAAGDGDLKYEKNEDGDVLIKGWGTGGGGGGGKKSSNNSSPKKSKHPIRKTTSGGQIKTPSSIKNKQKGGGAAGGSIPKKGTIRRSVSTGSYLSQLGHKGSMQYYDDQASLHSLKNSEHMSSLFQIQFPEDPAKMVQVREFERVESNLKQDLWYFGKELKYMVACEVEKNRAYEEGEIELQANQTMEDVCCWRGLEHVWEGEDRSLKIRRTVSGIVHWYKDAKDMGYTDPDELRVVAKARTKADRHKAQKKAQQDAHFIKKLHKADLQANGDIPSSPSHSKHHNSMSPKRIVKRISSKINMPNLHWSPKPSKKTPAVAS